MYLLDTDTCIQIARGDATVLKRLRAEERSAIHVSILTLCEMEVGVRKATQLVARKRAALLELIELFTVAPFGIEEATEAAKVRAELEKRGEPIGAIDYLIAGSARSHGWKLVTGNVREFSKVRGLKVENWIASAPHAPRG